METLEMRLRNMQRVSAITSNCLYKLAKPSVLLYETNAASMQMIMKQPSPYGPIWYMCAG